MRSSQLFALLRGHGTLPCTGIIRQRYRPFRGTLFELVELICKALMTLTLVKCKTDPYMAE